MALAVSINLTILDVTDDAFTECLYLLKKKCVFISLIKTKTYEATRLTTHFDEKNYQMQCNYINVHNTTYK